MQGSALGGIIFRWHRDRRGALLIYTFLSALALLWTVFLLFNTGVSVDAKIRVQNGVDAAALSHEVWRARGMNMISSNNVAMTQALAWICVIRGMGDTLKVTNVALTVMHAVGTALKAFPLTSAIGTAMVLYVTQIGRPAQQAMEKLHEKLKGADLDDSGQPGPLWRVMKALSIMSDKVRVAAPAVAKLSVLATARDNGVPFAVPYPVAGEDATLPVVETPFDELRDPTLNGIVPGSAPPNRSGYARFTDPVYTEYMLSFFAESYSPGNGPLKVERAPIRTMFMPLYGVGAPPLFDKLTEYHLDRLTGGSAEPPVAVVPMSGPDDTDGMVEERWHHSLQVWVDGVEVDANGTVPVGVPRPTVQETSARPVNLWAYDQVTDVRWERSGGGGVYQRHDGSNGRYETMESYSWLGGERRGQVEASQGTVGDKPPFFSFDGSNSSQRAVLVAGVYSPSFMIAPASFGEGGKAFSSWGYGQAALFNPSSEDTFTQDWRAKLAPGTLLEEGLEELLGGLSALVPGLEVPLISEAGTQEELLTVVRALNLH